MGRKISGVGVGVEKIIEISKTRRMVVEENGRVAVTGDARIMEA